MKKLFFASVFALATLTACNNETSTTTPEEQQNQTFSSQTMAREGEEMTEEQQEAIDIVKRDYEAGGGTDTSRILCHGEYSAPGGTACVEVRGHIYQVTWQTWAEGDTTWTSAPKSNCKCETRGLPPRNY